MASGLPGARNQAEQPIHWDRAVSAGYGDQGGSDALSFYFYLLQIQRQTNQKFFVCGAVALDSPSDHGTALSSDNASCMQSLLSFSSCPVILSILGVEPYPSECATHRCVGPKSEQKREGTICPGASGPLNGVGVPSLLRWPSTSRPRVARGEAAGQPRRRGVTRDDPGRLPASSGEHRTQERAVYVTAAPENGDGRGPLSRTREAERQGHAVYVTAASTGTTRPTAKGGSPHEQKPRSEATRDAGLEPAAANIELQSAQSTSRLPRPGPHALL